MKILPKNHTENKENLPRFLTVLECAKILRVHKTTLWKAIQRGAVPAVKMGRRVCIPRDFLFPSLQALSSKK